MQPLEVDFVFKEATRQTYVYHHPRHVASNLVTTDIYIKKTQYPDGPPDRIKIRIEAQ